jgi:hypothetical protein
MLNLGNVAHAFRFRCQPSVVLLHTTTVATFGFPHFALSFEPTSQHVLAVSMSKLAQPAAPLLPEQLATPAETDRPPNASLAYTTPGIGREDR